MNTASWIFIVVMAFALLIAWAMCRAASLGDEQIRNSRSAWDQELDGFWHHAEVKAEPQIRTACRISAERSQLRRGAHR